MWCSLDYVQLIGLLANNEPQTQCMAEYVCELALLQSDLGPYPQAEIAASAVLLARLALKKGTGKFEFSSTLFMVSYGINPLTTGYKYKYLKMVDLRT